MKHVIGNIKEAFAKRYQSFRDSPQFEQNLLYPRFKFPHFPHLMGAIAALERDATIVSDVAAIGSFNTSIS